MSLVYYPDENTQSVRYYINGWISISDYPQRVTLYPWALDNILADTFLPSQNKADSDITMNTTLLTLSFGTHDGTLDAVKKLMKERVAFISGALKPEINGGR